MHTGPIIILSGGLSPERDVSLRSGRRVAQALRRRDLDVDVVDVDASLAAQLSDRAPSCVIPLVHGAVGEDGALQRLISGLSLPYVGSSADACAQAFAKPTANRIVREAGVSVPDFIVLAQSTFREQGAREVLVEAVAQIGLPLIVKPSQGGSSLGVTVVRDESELPAAMVSAFAYGDNAILQSFIEGTEVAVGVLDTGAAAQALPVVEIRADGGIYDYHARYTAGSTEFAVPAHLPAETLAACERTALSIHSALGLRDWSRSDLIADSQGRVWFLEANVAPGMTETSTYPQAVHAAGLHMGDMVESLIARAIARG
jgi:D-alanine-D-alanine ligase